MYDYLIYTHKYNFRRHIYRIMKIFNENEHDFQGYCYDRLAKKFSSVPSMSITKNNIDKFCKLSNIDENTVILMVESGLIADLDFKEMDHYQFEW